MNSTKKPLKAQSPTPTNVEENQPSSIFSNSPISEDDELDYSKQFKDTVIWIRGRQNVGYFGTIGMRRVTDVYETPMELEKALKWANWNLLLNIVTALVTEMIAKIELAKGELTQNIENLSNK